MASQVIQGQSYFFGPGRCSHCQRCGHVARHGQGSQRCKFCLGPHSYSSAQLQLPGPAQDCTNSRLQPKCANCEGPQSSLLIATATASRVCGAATCSPPCAVKPCHDCRVGCCHASQPYFRSSQNPLSFSLEVVPESSNEVFLTLSLSLTTKLFHESERNCAL